ncbi:hypothetical protein AX774_g4114 [Zancudomyces culisetae]|uniref:Uncharacterized protein n=1 Tax=Zancudomyces culisetae TaxID=1213189 RepID=A0A1R1PN77_ZANCU|nr:hypothetical protein AX774_g4114 [Zancudomyces culisetae]|eukprot:OMH82410.1 hypothetical protein AX774_g4114 [Zancudomyces culisetae]
MLKSVLVSALLLGSTLANPANNCGAQQKYNNDLANTENKDNIVGSKYNDLTGSKYNDLTDAEYNELADSEYDELADSEFNDMHRCCRRMKTTVRLYKSPRFRRRYAKRSIRVGKCYNTRKFGSIKLGRKSGLETPGKGVIVVCSGKDCTGACQVVRRSSSKTIRNIPKVLGRRAISFAWLMVRRT